MAEWQKCPVCDGTGRVIRPPWVAGDQPEWSATNAGLYPCKVCVGSGLILRPPEPSPPPGTGGAK